MTTNIELRNYFEINYNDSPNPCLITEKHTKEVIFMNYPMEKLLKEAGCQRRVEDFSMSDYQHIFTEYTILKDDLKKYKFTEHHVQCPALGKAFRVNSTLIEYQDKMYTLSKYFVTSSYSSQMYTIDEAMTKSVEIFANKFNFKEMTQSFLELLGEFYEVDFTYVVYFNEELSQLNSDYRWTRNNKPMPLDEMGDGFPLDQMVAWAEARAIDNIIDISSHYPNISDMDKQTLALFGVENTAFCLIRGEDDKCIGVVGFYDRPRKTFDDRLLRAVTRFIQEGFTKAGMQEELKAIGETDFLTGFYSRPKYATELSKFQMFPPKQLGVVFVNMNGLRKTNEYLGFTKGDEQIKKTADMLRCFFTEPFYRISGDEFVCFCEDETEKQFLTKLNNLRREVKGTDDFPFAIGHAWATGNVNAERLVAEADTVMYINKQEYYHTTHKISGVENESVLNDLLTAISNEEFLVYLQPQVRLLDNEVIGAEALIRRFDKSLNKMVFPDQFIPLYEQKSIIRHVDIFVLNKVCQLLTLWGKQWKQIPISVNLSRVTLMEFDIVNTLSKICDSHGIPHELIIVEITERIGLIENEVATTLIDEFRAKGFKISLDDFGCAYSNIVTLANITVDEVKIDKSLIDNLLTNNKNQIIVKSMIEMCNQFENTHTLAEGIEVLEQADILRDYGCNYVQGYHYSRPIPNEEFFEKYVLKKEVVK